MIDKNLFGKVIIRTDKRGMDYSYRDRPFFLVYANEDFQITNDPISPTMITITPSILDIYDFIDYKELLKQAKAVFKRYVKCEQENFDGKTYTTKKVVDVLYELPSDIIAYKRLNEETNEYDHDGHIFLQEKDYIKNFEFIKDIEHNVSLSDVYNDTIVNKTIKDITDEKIKTELVNLFIDNLKNPQKFDDLYHAKNQHIVNAIKFYNEKLKNKKCNKNSIEEENVL